MAAATGPVGWAALGTAIGIAAVWLTVQKAYAFFNWGYGIACQVADAKKAGDNSLNEQVQVHNQLQDNLTQATNAGHAINDAQTAIKSAK